MYTTSLDQEAVDTEDIEDLVLDTLPINPTHHVDYDHVIELAREARDNRLRVVRSQLVG
jgi:hypothetical protein